MIFYVFGVKMNKEKFYENYFSDNKNIEKYRKSLRYKEENFPKSLYKYKDFDENGFTFDLLENDLLYMNTVYQFNDPYEGDFIYNIDEIFNFHFSNRIIYEFFNHPNNKMSKNEKSSILKDNPFENLMNYIYYNDPLVNKELSIVEFREKNKEFLEEYFSHTYEDFNDFLKNITLISCFSEKNTINPMWAHYAKNHTGICIEYNFLDYDEVFIYNSCFPMNYVEHFDITNDLKEMDLNNNYKFKILKLPFLNKSIDWQYECEWRILLTNDPLLRFYIKKINSNYYIQIPRPRAVYLGLDIDEENKEKIIEICKNREITVYKMEKDNSGYNLKPKLLFDAPKGKWDDENYILECLMKKSYKNLIKKYFSIRTTFGEIDKKQNKIIECLKEVPENLVIHFLDFLLFKNEIFPVLNDYYSQILIFLNRLSEDEYFKDLKTSDGLSIKENLEQWISYSLFKFYDLRIVRYLIFFEKLFKRFYTFYLVLDENSRNKFAKKLPEFKINDKYLSLIEFTDYKKDSENETYFIHPLCDIDFSELIDNNILNNLEGLLDKYYDGGEFREEECYEEYLKLKKVVEDLEIYGSKNYDEIYNNSRDRLFINFEALIYPYFDDYLSTICSVLYNNKLLNLLNNEEKEFLKNLNGIRLDDGKFENPSRISSFLGECCEELDLKSDEVILKPKELDGYFPPKVVSLAFLEKIE